MESSPAQVEWREAHDGEQWPPARRVGFALPVTILALVVLGALITGGLAIASQESRPAPSLQFSTLAYMAAERGLAHAIRSADGTAYETIPLGEVRRLLADTVDQSGFPTERVVRARALGNDLYFVESTGRVLGDGTEAGGVHRTGVLVRSTPAETPGGPDRVYPIEQRSWVDLSKSAAPID